MAIVRVRSREYVIFERMANPDYRQRFMAEYEYVLRNIKKLGSFLEKWDKGELDFEPKCPKPLLQKQLEVMSEYMKILEERAEIEDINPEDILREIRDPVRLRW